MQYRQELCWHCSQTLSLSPYLPLPRSLYLSGRVLWRAAIPAEDIERKYALKAEAWQSFSHKHEKHEKQQTTCETHGKWSWAWDKGGAGSCRGKPWPDLTGPGLGWVIKHKAARRHSSWYMRIYVNICVHTYIYHIICARLQIYIHYLYVFVYMFGLCIGIVCACACLCPRAEILCATETIFEIYSTLPSPTFPSVSRKGCTWTPVRSSWSTCRGFNRTINQTIRAAAALPLELDLE